MPELAARHLAAVQDVAKEVLPVGMHREPHATGTRLAVHLAWFPRYAIEELHLSFDTFQERGAASRFSLSMATEVRRSVYALDCPDACTMMVTVKDGVATPLRGDLVAGRSQDIWIASIQPTGCCIRSDAWERRAKGGLHGMRLPHGWRGRERVWAGGYPAV